MTKMDSQTQAQQTHVDAVQSLDLSAVLERMIAKEGWRTGPARCALAQYRNFLRLHIKYPQQFLVPSVDIDAVWHNHILFTRQYHADTQRIFGHYFHHQPAPANAPSVEYERLQSAYAQTQALYRQEFGDYIYAARQHVLIEQTARMLMFLGKRIVSVFKWLHFPAKQSFG